MDIHNNQQLPGALTRAQFDADPNQAGTGAQSGNHQLDVDTDRVAARSTLNPLVSATWNHFVFDHDPNYGNNRLPAAPVYAVHGEVMLRDTSGLYAGPTFDLVGARYADFTNSYRVNAYQLVGLRAGYEHDQWGVYVEAINLADSHYVSTLSVRNQAATGDPVLNPGAPRSVFVGTRFRF